MGSRKTRYFAKVLLCLFILFGQYTAVVTKAWADESINKVEFKDVEKSDPNALYISYLYERGLLKGFPDGTFRPDQVLTRAETAVVLDRAAKLPEVRQTRPFKDLKNSYWAASSINSLVKAGIISGYPDGTFRPKAEITRAEGISLVLLISGEPDNGVALPALQDVSAKHWAARQIAQGIDAQMIGLSKDGQRFYPGKGMTRGELARAIGVLLTNDPELAKLSIEGSLRVIEGEATLDEVNGQKLFKTGETTIVHNDTVIKTGAGSSAEVIFPDGTGVLIQEGTEVSINEMMGKSYLMAGGHPGVSVDWLDMDLKIGEVYVGLATSYHKNDKENDQDNLVSDQGSQILPRINGNKIEESGVYAVVALNTPVPQKKDLPWYQASQGQKVRVEVDMPWGVATIRGTFGQFIVLPNGSGSASVLTGHAAVASDGTSYDLTGGQSIEGQPGQPLGVPGVMTPDQSEEWQVLYDWIMKQANMMKNRQEAEIPDPPDTLLLNEIDEQPSGELAPSGQELLYDVINSLNDALNNLGQNPNTAAEGNSGSGGGNGGGGSDPSNNAKLSNLLISNGPLISFSPDIYTYSIDVTYDVSSVDVNCIAQDSNAHIKIGNEELGSIGNGNANIALQEGENVITVLVTAPDGTSQETYTVMIKRAPLYENYLIDQVTYADGTWSIKLKATTHNSDSIGSQLNGWYELANDVTISDGLLPIDLNFKIGDIILSNNNEYIQDIHLTSTASSVDGEDLSYNQETGQFEMNNVFFDKAPEEDFIGDDGSTVYDPDGWYTVYLNNEEVYNVIRQSDSTPALVDHYDPSSGILTFKNAGNYYVGGTVSFLDTNVCLFNGKAVDFGTLNDIQENDVLYIDKERFGFDYFVELYPFTNSGEFLAYKVGSDNNPDEIKIDGKWYDIALNSALSRDSGTDFGGQIDFIGLEGMYGKTITYFLNKANQVVYVISDVDSVGESFIYGTVTDIVSINRVSYKINKIKVLMPYGESELDIDTEDVGLLYTGYSAVGNSELDVDDFIKFTLNEEDKIDSLTLLAYWDSANNEIIDPSLVAEQNQNLEDYVDPDNSAYIGLITAADTESNRIRFNEQWYDITEDTLVFNGNWDDSDVDADAVIEDNRDFLHWAENLGDNELSAGAYVQYDGNEIEVIYIHSDVWGSTDHYALILDTYNVDNEAKCADTDIKGDRKALEIENELYPYEGALYTYDIRSINHSIETLDLVFDPDNIEVQNQYGIVKEINQTLNELRIVRDDNNNGSFEDDGDGIWISANEDTTIYDYTNWYENGENGDPEYLYDITNVQLDDLVFCILNEDYPEENICKGLFIVNYADIYTGYNSNGNSPQVEIEYLEAEGNLITLELNQEITSFYLNMDSTGYSEIKLQDGNTYKIGIWNQNDIPLPIAGMAANENCLQITMYGTDIYSDYFFKIFSNAYNEINMNITAISDFRFNVYGTVTDILTTNSINDEIKEIKVLMPYGETELEIDTEEVELHYTSYPDDSSELHVDDFIKFTLNEENKIDSLTLLAYWDSDHDVIIDPVTVVEQNQNIEDYVDPVNSAYFGLITYGDAESNRIKFNGQWYDMMEDTLVFNGNWDDSDDAAEAAIENNIDFLYWAENLGNNELSAGAYVQYDGYEIKYIYIHSDLWETGHYALIHDTYIDSGDPYVTVDILGELKSYKLYSNAYTIMEDAIYNYLIMNNKFALLNADPIFEPRIFANEASLTEEYLSQYSVNSYVYGEVTDSSDNNDRSIEINGEVLYFDENTITYDYSDFYDDDDDPEYLFQESDINQGDFIVFIDNGNEERTAGMFIIVNNIGELSPQ